MTLAELRLKFVTPQNDEEMAAALPEFEFLHHFVVEKLAPEEFESVLKSAVGCATLIYINEILFGCFIYDIYKKTVELHGIIRPDGGQFVPAFKRVKQHLMLMVLDDIFFTMERDKVVILQAPANKGVRGFAIMFGFQPLKNKDKGRTVWVLHKDKYIERKQRLYETKKGNALYSEV